MNDLIKGLSSAGLGALAGAGLVSTSFFAVEALIPQPADANSDPEFTKGLETCIATRKAVVPHEEGYRDGKLLAQILNVVSQEGMGGMSGAAVKSELMRTRSNLPGLAAVYLQQDGRSELAGCYLVKWKPIQTQAWSSVHAGLTDYLTPSLKAHFLAIPER